MVDHHAAHALDFEHCSYCLYQLSNDGLPALDIEWELQAEPTLAILAATVVNYSFVQIITATARAPPF